MGHPLLKYIPEIALDYCEEIIKDYSVKIKITKSRNSKLGDFKLLNTDWKYQITVNHNLNKYEFLITYIHEVAHMVAFEKYGNRHQPHGVEWKNEYSKLLKKALENQIFETELIPTIERHLRSPGASSCADPELQRELKKYDTDSSETVFLESLPFNAPFMFKGKIFILQHKYTSRYEVIAIPELRIFKLNGLAEVLLIEDTELLANIKVYKDRYDSFEYISSLPPGASFLEGKQVFKKANAQKKPPFLIVNLKNMQGYTLNQDIKVERV